jgi:hypothetical protein
LNSLRFAIDSGFIWKFFDFHKNYDNFCHLLGFYLGKRCDRSCIGKGTYGAVVSATNKDTGKGVAIKKLSKIEDVVS